MPEMGGLEATAAIREKEKSTGVRLPIVAMTARAMRGDREACLAAGMDAYISKPMRVNELLKTIEGLGTGRARGAALKPELSDEDLDESALLAGVGGDAKLLREFVDLFLADCPKLLSEIRRAIADRDSKALASAAHALKGSVGNFTTRGAFEAVAKLDTMARKGDWAGADEVLVVLEEEIKNLQGKLGALRERPHAGERRKARPSAKSRVRKRKARNGKR